jgi:hypothetical protein
MDVKGVESGEGGRREAVLGSILFRGNFSDYFAQNDFLSL